ncbi:hypothetical protein [Xenorhabdus bovienii]|uniref:hypothetical protein n=1 Tax=Xenorhabdus bovienii TaxID=40576 RepID=UPI0023B29EE7|nr:hypothetical protein [Xenorhabdus bovienii]MDE9427766.1 hypothetical protein [Xenorhabdus bovienii]
MTKTELIEYLHSAYPELTIDTNYIKGYSEEDILKLESLRDFKIQGQLREFLTYMGRCSGGLFGSQPLKFYPEIVNPKGKEIYQSECRKDLVEIEGEDILNQKPFFISIENEGIYDYFLLTDSDSPDLVYYIDSNYNTIVDTGLTFNKYLRSVVDSSRSYIYKVPTYQEGDLIKLYS